MRYGTRLGITHNRLTALDAYFARWGEAAVAVGRIAPFARPFVPLMAGASDWPYRRFLPWSVAGTGAFAVGCTVLGYAAYATAERVIETAGRAALVAASAVLALIVLLARLRRRSAARRPPRLAGERR